MLSFRFIFFYFSCNTSFLSLLKWHTNEEKKASDKEREREIIPENSHNRYMYIRLRYIFFSLLPILCSQIRFPHFTLTRLALKATEKNNKICPIYSQYKGWKCLLSDVLSIIFDRRRYSFWNRRENSNVRSGAFRFVRKMPYK